jgi:spore maturation protein CgeB
MGVIKDRSIDTLKGGLKDFESGKNIIRNTDFKSLETFMEQYLNICDKKKRTKVAEEFKKRHLELYEFLKSNSELVSAETQISKMISDAMKGTAKEKNQELNNLLYDGHSKDR